MERLEGGAHVATWSHRGSNGHQREGDEVCPVAKRAAVWPSYHLAEHIHLRRGAQV